MIVSSTEIEVRYAETDMMGIVYHANYLPWLEIGRTNLLKELNLPYKELEEAGKFLPVLEINVKYLKPAKYDDRIEILTTMKDKPLARIHMEYEVKRSEELLATAYSVHAFMNKEGTPIKPPEDFLSIIEEAFDKS